jgi:hypothetical protein
VWNLWSGVGAVYPCEDKVPRDEAYPIPVAN